MRVVILVTHHSTSWDQQHEPSSDIACLRVGGQFDVDPVNRAKPPEQPLRGRDVDHANAPPLGNAGQETAHDHRLRPAIGVDRHPVTNAQLSLRSARLATGTARRLQTHSSALPPGPLRRCANQAGRHPRRTDDIKPQQGERLTARSDCLHHNNRAGIGHAFNPR